MKKYPIVFAISALMLAACNGDEEQTVEDEQAEATEVEAEEVTDEDEEEPEVVEEEADEDDGLLTEVGATVSEDGYELELLAYHDEPINVTIGEYMDVTYEDVKVLHRNNDDRVHEAEFAWITDRTEFDYVQININVENLSEEHVNFNPIAQIVTNSGQQIDYFDAEFVQYYSNAEVAGEFREGVKKDGFMAFILPENFDVDELEWLRFYTNDVFSEDTFETLAGEEEIEINF